MADLKTKQTEKRVEDFLNEIENEQKRNDSFELVKIMSAATGEQPKMWGESIVGFGCYHYKYDSGLEGDWPIVGFSPRKQNISLYLMAGFEHYGELLKQLGKHKTGAACLYINKLTDVDKAVLRKLIDGSIAFTKEKYPNQ